jgi:hypothetical protein
MGIEGGRARRWNGAMPIVTTTLLHHSPSSSIRCSWYHPEREYTAVTEDIKQGSPPHPIHILSFSFSFRVGVCLLLIVPRRNNNNNAVQERKATVSWHISKYINTTYTSTSTTTILYYNTAISPSLLIIDNLNQRGRIVLWIPWYLSLWLSLWL